MNCIEPSGSPNLIYDLDTIKSGCTRKGIAKIAFWTHQGDFVFTIMPFGLLNAPSSFQALTNSIFQKYMSKFALLFFCDILIYSQGWNEQLHHVRIVLYMLIKPVGSEKEQLNYLGI